jgi:hypothetical protein
MRSLLGWTMLAYAGGGEAGMRAALAGGCERTCTIANISAAAAKATACAPTIAAMTPQR